jgi:hypothetical protein
VLAELRRSSTFARIHLGALTIHDVHLRLVSTSSARGLAS